MAPVANRGKLVLDATCIPGDIRFPLDSSLVSEARAVSEKIIDSLWLQLKKGKKPRTYRKIAKKRFLSIAKSRQPGSKKAQNAVKAQLRYMRRNLRHIEHLLRQGAITSKMSKNLQQRYETIQLVYDQQNKLYFAKEGKVKQRIISVSQPHIRAIYRGKQGRRYEYGAKVSASYFNDGLIFFDKISFEPFNESLDLKMQVEKYKERTGAYPSSLHVDKIYRTRDNRQFCAERNIRMSGPKLGAPRKLVDPEEQKQRRADEAHRSTIEGRFGNLKRRFGAGRIFTRLKSTSMASISFKALAINLITISGAL